MNSPRPHPPRKTAQDPDDVPLELDEIATNDQHAKRRRATFAAKEEDLSDLTFTKPGQSLLTKKSLFDRARGTGKQKASWNQMRQEFLSLGQGRQLIVWAVLGTAALLFLILLSRLAYQGLTYAVASGKSLIRAVSENVTPDVAPIQIAREQFVEQMRTLWQDVQTVNNEPLPSNLPQRAQTPHVDGDAWPERDRDQLTSKDLVEPASLISSLMQHKGIPLTNDGLGVFHTDNGKRPEHPLWIGGFGLTRERGTTPKPLLHGTLVHHPDENSTYVATFVQGNMQQFWFVEGPPQKRRIFSGRLSGKLGNSTLDGAAFVLDQHRTMCLALDFKAGDLIGGQWCGKRKDDEGTIVFDPPTTIATTSSLRADGPDFDSYLSIFTQAMKKSAEVHKDAIVELRQFQKTLVKSK